MMSVPSSRRESRIPMRMFVKLSMPESGKAELAHTVDISCHGARISSRNFWNPNEHISVRSIRGNLYSRARVAHCEALTDGSFVVGLELYFTTGDWTA